MKGRDILPFANQGAINSSVLVQQAGAVSL
jgi:hypothetical protein